MDDKDNDKSAAQPGDKYIVRFPEGMRERIKDEAARNQRSMNAEIVNIIQAHFRSKDFDVDSLPSDDENEVLVDLFAILCELDRLKERHKLEILKAISDGIVRKHPQ